MKTAFCIFVLAALVAMIVAKAETDPKKAAGGAEKSGADAAKKIQDGAKSGADEAKKMGDQAEKAAGNVLGSKGSKGDKPGGLVYDGLRGMKKGVDVLTDTTGNMFHDLTMI